MYSPSPLDLEITVVSAKHLKNVNWRNGDLKPYAAVCLDHDPHLRLSTRPDDSGSTRPVWNETLTIPLSAPAAAAASSSPGDATLAVQVFHSRPSETPKPLVGSARLPLSQLLDSDGDAPRVYALDLYRPSGRPQGKLRVKLAVRERPPPPPPPPPPPSDPAPLRPASAVEGGDVAPPRGCKACGREELERGCNGEGRIQGGIATVPGFGWWPIKAYRPCPGFVASGGRYRRQGQSMDEVAFGRGGSASGDESDSSS